MPTATVSSKSQIVLPAAIRRRLGIRPGDRLIIEVDGDGIRLRKLPLSDLESLASLRGALWRGADAEVANAREEGER